MVDIPCPQFGRNFPPDDDECSACCGRAIKPVLEKLHGELIGHVISSSLLAGITAELCQIHFDCPDKKRPVFMVVPGDRPDLSHYERMFLTDLDPNRIDILCHSRK